MDPDPITSWIRIQKDKLLHAQSVIPRLQHMFGYFKLSVVDPDPIRIDFGQLDPDPEDKNASCPHCSPSPTTHVWYFKISVVDPDPIRIGFGQLDPDQKGQK